MDIAFNFNRFRFIDLHFQSFFELGLSHIKRAIGLAVGMDIVENAVWV
jgi:hypothetical protein